MTLDYAIQTATIADKLGTFHRALRPLMSLFRREIPHMHSQFQKASALLEPILRERLASSRDENLQKPDDLVQWIIDSETQHRDNLLYHTRIQMEAVQAATFNLAFQVLASSPFRISSTQLTTLKVINFIIDLAARPEYMEPLRKELDHHCPSGELGLQSISKLWKLDSFLKESQRINAMSVGK